MTRAPTLLIICALAWPLLATADNECTTVVLHGFPGLTTWCSPPNLPPDCQTVMPTTGIPAYAEWTTVIVYLRNYDMVTELQVAFDWPATWDLGFSYYYCRMGSTGWAQPVAPGGPDAGTLGVSFNYMTGGRIEPVALLAFRSVGPGCVSVIESSHEFGNYVRGGQENERTALQPENYGAMVCVGREPRNTCECMRVTPVEASTWGEIKAGAAWGR